MTFTLDVDRTLVLRLARLASLELDEGAVSTVESQLQQLLSHFRALNEFQGWREVKDNSLMADFYQPLQEARPDEVTPSLPVGEALGLTPESAESQFVVPRVT